MLRLGIFNFDKSKRVKNFLAPQKTSNYYNSQEFYERCPDLAPRNIYLRMGRVVNVDDVHKTIRRFGNPWWKKLLYPVEDFFDKIRKSTK